MRKVIQKAMNRVARVAIGFRLPGVIEEISSYSQRSGTTGTQWITLWMAIDTILKKKPTWILEAGTGSSTIALAAAVRKLKNSKPGYQGRIVSMESMKEWHETAIQNLPKKYSDIVEIVYGPKEKYEVAMFRGYIHSNIPKHDYQFVLIDGPSFQDENGIAFCADIFKALELTRQPIIHGVSDGRASTVYVIQQIIGSNRAKYWHGLFAARFSLNKQNFRESILNTPKDFKASATGKLEFIKFRQKKTKT